MGRRAIRASVPIAFGALIAFGCVLRFWKLAGVGFWYDELWTVVGANRPFGEMYREWILGDAHPPGFFLFYFAWLKIVPATEFWSRLPSAIAGVLTVAFLLFGTKDVFNRDERLTIASFASLSYIYVFYALSVKQYSAMLLFATVDTIAYLEIVAAQHVDRRRGLTLTAASLALAYLNHFGFVYAAMLLAFLIVRFRGEADVRRRLLRIVGVCAIGYAPIAPFLYIQIKYNIDAWQPYQVGTFLSGLGPSLLFDDPAYLARALGVLAVALAWRAAAKPDLRRALWTSRNRHVAIVVLAFAGFMLAIGLFKPIFYVRYFLVVAPAALLAIGIVVSAALPIAEGWPALLLLAFFLHAAETQFQSIDALQREQWDKSVDFVLEARAPADSVYVVGANMDKTEFDYLREGDVDGVFNVRNVKFYRYYFRRRGAGALAARLRVVLPTAASVRDLAAHFRGTHATIYILAAHHLRYQGEALATLQRAARRLDITAMNGTLVYKLTF